MALPFPFVTVASEYGASTAFEKVVLEWHGDARRVRLRQVDPAVFLSAPRRGTNSIQMSARVMATHDAFREGRHSPLSHASNRDRE
jgi:hypothetical protein